MKKLSILLMLVTVSMMSCSDDLRVTTLCDALVLWDDFYVADYIDDILEGLAPYPDYYDYIGHEENLLILIDELEIANDCLDASILCYACIYTWPPRTELLIEIVSDGIVSRRILDIATPENRPMYFVGMRE